MRFDDLSLAWLRGKPGKKWAEVDHDVLAAWVADMDFPTPGPVADALRHHISWGDLGYPADDDRLDHAFARRMRERHGWRPEPGRLREVTDVLNGLEMILSLTTRPGDGVAVHAPTYPPFLDAFERFGLEVHPIPFRRTATGWGFDRDQALEAITGAKVAVIVNPHNPTGRVLDRGELDHLAGAAMSAGATIISDEVWADLIYPGRGHVPTASLSPEVAAHTVTLTSATKAFNLAGIRCAVAHVGAPDLWHRLETGPQHVFGLVSNLGRVATRAAWEEAEGWRAGLVQHLDGNRRRIAEHLSQRLPKVRYSPPDATYLAWLDVSAYDLGDNPVEVVEADTKLRLTPGSDFGPAGAGHVRLNFATSGPILDAALIRLETALGVT